MKVVIIIFFACVLEWIVRKALTYRQKAKRNSIHSNISNYDISTKDNSDEKEHVVINSFNEIKEEKHKEEPKEKIIYNENYRLPSISLLDINHKYSIDQEVIKNNIERIEELFNSFNIKVEVICVTVGPIYSLYEFAAAKGTRLSDIVSLNRELSMALAKKHVNIQAPIPGKGNCGVEIENDVIETVYFKGAIEKIVKGKNKIIFILGKDMLGEYVLCDIKKMPNILVSGATNTGKTMLIRNIIMSILMTKKPDEVRLILIDTKKIDLSMYNGIPHLLCPVVTDSKKAAAALQKVVSEMEHRYDLFEEKRIRNIDDYNDYVEKENKLRSPADKMSKLSSIVVIIDEIADLMMIANKEVEDAIMRITKMARAAGIHLIIATQRPSTDVITGVIKANILTRISFAVSSGIDSRTIIDMKGAEKLIGHGDMLFMTLKEKEPTHILGTYVSDDEIDRVIKFVVKQQSAQYDSRFENYNIYDTKLPDSNLNGDVKDEYDDPLYDDIVEFVVTTGKASASLLQRRFKLGYNRAARVIDLLEERGIIGPAEGIKPREVLVRLNKNDDEEN